MVRLLVFSDKDNEPCASTRNPPSLFTILQDVKEPTHCWKRVGQGVPCVVVRPCCGRIPSIGTTSSILSFTSVKMNKVNMIW